MPRDLLGHRVGLLRCQATLLVRAGRRVADGEDVGRIAHAEVVADDDEAGRVARQARGIGTGQHREVNDPVARQAGAGPDLDDGGVRHGRLDAGHQVDARCLEQRACQLAGRRPEDAQRLVLGCDERQLARPDEGGRHQRQLVGRQRPAAAGRRDDRDGVGQARAQVGDDLVESLDVVRALEADAMLVGRVGGGSDGEHEHVVGQYLAGLQAHEVLGVLDARDRVLHERDVELGRELGERVALRPTRAERLEDLERTDREVVPGCHERQCHAVTHEPAQCHDRLEAGDSRSGHHDPERLVVSMRRAFHGRHGADCRRRCHPGCGADRPRGNYGRGPPARRTCRGDDGATPKPPQGGGFGVRPDLLAAISSRARLRLARPQARTPSPCRPRAGHGA
jgi:hypothetical protein